MLYTYYQNQKYQPFLQWARKSLYQSSLDSKDDVHSQTQPTIPPPPLPSTYPNPKSKKDLSSSPLDSQKQELTYKTESKALS